MFLEFVGREGRAVMRVSHGIYQAATIRRRRFPHGAIEHTRTAAASAIDVNGFLRKLTSSRSTPFAHHGVVCVARDVEHLDGRCATCSWSASIRPPPLASHVGHEQVDSACRTPPKAQRGGGARQSITLYPAALEHASPQRADGIVVFDEQNLSTPLGSDPSAGACCTAGPLDRPCGAVMRKVVPWSIRLSTSTCPPLCLQSRARREPQPRALLRRLS